MWIFTLLLFVSIGIVETPDLRHKSAQIDIGWVVLPGSPVRGPGDFTSQSTHTSIPIRVHYTTAGHDTGCAFGGSMLVEMAVGLGMGGRKEGSKGKKA